MKTALVVRHLAAEDLGVLQPLLESAGYAIRHIELDMAAGQESLAADLVLVLGEPTSAPDGKACARTQEEANWLRHRLLADRPTLGIGFGAQLMARALNAKADASNSTDVGWGPLMLGREGEDFAGMAEYAAQAPAVPHGHGDMYALPSGARHLAASSGCENQAFAWGAHCLALRFPLPAQPATARFFATWLGTLSGCRCKPVLAPLVRMERQPCRRHF